MRRAQKKKAQKPRSMTPHQDECAADVRVLTADSASCFFLAMSVAELFLCSSSSLRSTDTRRKGRWGKKRQTPAIIHWGSLRRLCIM